MEAYNCPKRTIFYSIQKITFSENFSFLCLIGAKSVTYYVIITIILNWYHNSIISKVILRANCDICLT